MYVSVVCVRERVCAFAGTRMCVKVIGCAHVCVVHRNVRVTVRKYGVCV